MMELSNIVAGYGEKEILHGVSLTVCPGTVTVLVGPNGCGKSTLLRVAARLMPFTSGQISIQDTDTSHWNSRAFAQRVALLPQSRPVPEITVRSLILHGRFPYLGYPRRYSATDRQAALQAMEQTGILDLAEQSVSRLSGGQRQKVYLAMAIAQSTPILLLDEPTTFLDIGHQLELAHLTRSLAQQGKAIVMVLHDLNLALSCADRVIVMDQGLIQGEGTSNEIYESRVLERVFGVKSHQVCLEDGTIQYLFTRETSFRR